MSKIAIAGVGALTLAFGCIAAAATDRSGVTMSTDPARAAAVEQHARELQARERAAMGPGAMHGETMGDMHTDHHGKHAHHGSHGVKSKPHTAEAPKS